MANSIQQKIYKLLKALEMRGEKYGLERRQYWSDKAGRMCTVKKLFKLTPTAEWNKQNPDKKPKDISARSLVRDSILDSFKDIEILIALVKIYQEGGSSGGTKK